MKARPWLLVVVAGMQWASSSFAAGEVVTNRDGDIAALKEQIQELNRKVRVLESRQASDWQTNNAIEREQIQQLDQQVRVLERQHELDRESAAAAAQTRP